LAWRSLGSAPSRSDTDFSSPLDANAHPAADDVSLVLGLGGDFFAGIVSAGITEEIVAAYRERKKARDEMRDAAQEESHGIT
jgi:hypothetical protein